jgi:hypothetical protein
MSSPLPIQIPHQQQVERKLAAVNLSIQTLQTLNDRQLDDQDVHVLAEAVTCGAIAQLLHALDATLYGFSKLLPDPLPHSRVSRRNLRDRFHAIQCESQVLRLMDEADRAKSGWLWWLERKAEGCAFFPLLFVEPQRAKALVLWRDPANHEAGLEPNPSPEYLRETLERMRELTRRVADLIPEDLHRYQEHWRHQRHHLL